MINYAFFGTDDFSGLVLEELVQAGYPPSLIVTMPDSCVGRKQELASPPIKKWGQEHGILVIQPERIKETPPELIGKDWDLFIVASYGKMIPLSIITIPLHGTVNIHPSLLPRHRGASPIEATILNGDRKGGVSVMLIDAEMDHGPLLAQKEFPLRGDEWYPELAEKLAREGGKLLAGIIPSLVDGLINAKEQDHEKATFTTLVKKEDGFVDLSADSEINFRKIRAYEPWPRTFFKTMHKGKEIRVIITAARKDGDILTLLRVIPEGGREMSYQEFKQGYAR